MTSIFKSLRNLNQRNHMLFNLEEIQSQSYPALNAKLSKIASEAFLLENFSEDESKEFDIFLSYSSFDREIVLKLVGMIEAFGYSVYVDWQGDPQLGQNGVSKKTAECLRNRLDHCKCLLYAATIGSKISKWMPWETGYMDAKIGRVAILPVAESHLKSRADIYHGQEYLSLYPYISKEKIEKTSKIVLWANESEHCYCKFDNWLNGEMPKEH